MIIEYTPVPTVTITGEYVAGDPGDRNTPPSSAYIDEDSLAISGPLSDVLEWLADYYVSHTSLAIMMREHAEARMEADADDVRESRLGNIHREDV